MQLLHEVTIEEDLEPFETSKETGEEIKREHGNNVESLRFLKAKSILFA